MTMQPWRRDRIAGHLVTGKHSWSGGISPPPAPKHTPVLSVARLRCATRVAPNVSRCPRRRDAAAPTARDIRQVWGSELSLEKDLSATGTASIARRKALGDHHP
jgi:hypothetical protein